MEHLTNNKLMLIIFISLLGLAIVGSIVGEKTLSLFGGDRDLAGRFYKTVYIVIGGGMLVAILPVLINVFVDITRRFFESQRITGGVAALFLQPSTTSTAMNIAAILMVLAALGTVAAAIMTWKSQS